jgi:thioredoxin reductase (NADPH)
VSPAQTVRDVTGVFVAIGRDPRTELVKGQVDLDPPGHITVMHPTTQTGLPGAFAGGDVVDHTYRQAITTAGTGCAAARDAERHLTGLAGRPSAATPEHAAS